MTVPLSGRESHLDRRSRRRSSGQGLAEFALVAPILVLLLVGLSQFAVIFETQIGITNAIREAARRTSTNPAPVCTWVLDEIKPSSGSGLLAANVQGYKDADSAVTVTFSAVDSGSSADFQTVGILVTYRHALFLPLIGVILDTVDGTADGKFGLSANVEMRLERTNGALVGQCQRP